MQLFSIVLCLAVCVRIRAHAFETPTTVRRKKPLDSAVVLSSKSKDKSIAFVDKHLTRRGGTWAKKIPKMAPAAILSDINFWVLYSAPLAPSVVVVVNFFPTQMR